MLQSGDTKFEGYCYGEFARFILYVTGTRHSPRRSGVEGRESSEFSKGLFTFYKVGYNGGLVGNSIPTNGFKVTDSPKTKGSLMV